MQGGCVCGAVRYTAGEALSLVNCHCRMCRGINGGAFSSYVVVHSDGFAARGDTLAQIQVGDSAIKHFCRHCGTPVFNTNPGRYPGFTMLYLGTVEGHEAMTPAVNIYSSSKLGWVDALGGLPSFEEGRQRGG